MNGISLRVMRTTPSVIIRQTTSHHGDADLRLNGEVTLAICNGFSYASRCLAESIEMFRGHVWI